MYFLFLFYIVKMFYVNYSEESNKGRQEEHIFIHMGHLYIIFYELSVQVFCPFFYFLFLLLLFSFNNSRERREGEREGEKQRGETDIHPLPLACATNWGLNPQPRHVPWLGIKLVSF